MTAFINNKKKCHILRTPYFSGTVFRWGKLSSQKRTIDNLKNKAYLTKIMKSVNNRRNIASVLGI